MRLQNFKRRKRTIQQTLQTCLAKLQETSEIAENSKLTDTNTRDVKGIRR